MLLSADGRTPIQSDEARKQQDEEAQARMKVLMDAVIATFNAQTPPATKYEGAMVGINLIITFLKSFPTMEKTQEASTHIGEMLNTYCMQALLDRKVELAVRQNIQAANQQGKPA